MTLRRLLNLINLIIVSTRRTYSGLSPLGSENNPWNKLFRQVAAERSELSQPKFEEHSYFLGIGLHLKNQEIIIIGLKGQERVDILRKLLIKHDYIYRGKDISEISEDTIKSRLKKARKRLLGMHDAVLATIYKIGRRNNGADRIINGESLKMESSVLKNSTSFKSMIDLVYDYSFYTDEQREKLVRLTMGTDVDNRNADPG